MIMHTSSIDIGNAMQIILYSVVFYITRVIFSSGHPVR